MKRSRLHELSEHGVSVWIDSLSREMLETGLLARLMDRGRRRRRHLEPDDLPEGARRRRLVRRAAPRCGREEIDDPVELFFALAQEDIRDACDLLEPVWERTGGVDGYVSLEVDPTLAYDRTATFEQAMRFHRELERKNLYVKIPGTEPGLGAIEDCIAEGRSINVTLIFSLERYAAVVEAYLRGLERLVAAGGDPGSVISVASFFVSRVDTEADRRLEEVGRTDLQGRLAIANAKLAYAHWKEAFSGDSLGRARGEGRAEPALPLGVDVDQEPGVPGRPLRRGADRAGDGEHDAARDDPGIPGPRRGARHARDRRRRGAGAPRRARERRASTTTMSSRRSSARASRSSPTRSASSWTGSPRSSKRSRPSSAGMANPLSAGLGLRRKPDPCALVVFGASGDLTKRKLFPALYALAYRGLLPDRFAVVGVARTEQPTRQFLTGMRAAVKQYARDPFRSDVFESLAEGVRYVATEFDDDSGEDRVGDALEELDRTRGTAGNRLHYLAVPPQAFPTVVREIGERREREGWARVIVEKPFGHDLASARELSAMVQRWFREDEVFRIDHYLGKETVQNLMALRFANGIFEPIWNRQMVDHVQITVAESMGIEGRAGYYERAGAIRDIFQNHLLQLLALTAMEPPIDFTADAVRNEKVKVLRAMHTPGPKSVVRGQYGRGWVEGEEVPAYREEQGVDPNSTTETYVAAKLFVDNWRWADTPFYVRVGKRLARRETTIAIQFKRAPHPPFEAIAGEGLRPNVLLIHVQPDEGVSLAIGAKVPGAGMQIRTVHMDFLYGGAFRESVPEAYERLILDAMLGDATLFTREDEVEEQWKLVDAMVGAWGRDRPTFPNYPAGSWGPARSDELVHRDGRSWRRH